MFKTLRFLFVAVIIAAVIAWLLDNNGSIIINWLGYEVRTDILTAILLMIFFTSLVFVIAYFSTKILSIKFPRISQILKRKKYDE